MPRRTRRLLSDSQSSIIDLLDPVGNPSDFRFLDRRFCLCYCLFVGSGIAPTLNASSVRSEASMAHSDDCGNIERSLWPDVEPGHPGTVISPIGRYTLACSGCTIASCLFLNRRRNSARGARSGSARRTGVVVLAAGRRSSPDARDALASTLRGLLVSAVRLRTAKGAFADRCPGPDSGLLRLAAGEEHRGQGRPYQRPIPIVSARVAQSLPGQGMASRRRP